MAQRIGIPDSVTRLGLLPRVDYADAFARDVPLEQPPRVCLRSALQGAPRGLLALVHTAQRAWGLRLRSRSYADPFGWRILRDDQHVLVIAADGPRRSLRLAVTTPSGRVEVSTQVRLEGRRARLGWRVLAPVHRLVVRVLLRRARIPADPSTRESLGA